MERSRLSNVVASLLVVGLMGTALFPTVLPVRGRAAPVAAGLLATPHGWRDAWKFLGANFLLLLTILVILLVGALYMRYLVAVGDLHCRVQLRRAFGAWRVGARDVEGQVLPRLIALLGLVATVIASGGIVVLGWIAWRLTLSSTGLFAHHPVAIALVVMVMFGGILARMAEETEAVRHVAQLVRVVHPRMPGARPATRESLRCALCDGDAVSRPLAMRMGADSRSAATRFVRRAEGPLARVALRLARVVRRDPVKVGLLVALILPAALGLSLGLSSLRCPRGG